MSNTLKRSFKRAANQIRPLKISYNAFGYATSSVLFEIGNTKVLCCVSLQNGVPPFLKGSNTGWLNAEYAMLPTATTVRTQRESATMKKCGRSTEISRLIGRSLRSIVALEKLGERTIVVDCDVLQADGGTRTACITASSIALEAAITHWVETKQLSESILKTKIAGISAGVYCGVPVLDLDFAEDNGIDADFNFVITKTGDIIEVQGTAEKRPISWEQFEQIRLLALQGVEQLFTFLENQPEGSALNSDDAVGQKTPKAPFFSLINRQKTV